jgi:hypothetical protein
LPARDPGKTCRTDPTRQRCFVLVVVVVLVIDPVSFGSAQRGDSVFPAEKQIEDDYDDDDDEKESALLQMGPHWKDAAALTW